MYIIRTQDHNQFDQQQIDFVNKDFKNIHAVPMCK